jgi:uncharacterized protein YdeI (YjbR/CyaY-like superfamily)
MKPLRFRDVAALEAWLEKNHAKADEVWLVVAKKHADGLHIVDALDVALCFGWIDGVRRAHDEDSFLQRYSPRRAGSSWSKINVDKVAVLTAAGRMRSSGHAQVELAKSDGRWQAAYIGQRDFTVPADVLAALKSKRAAFAKLEKGAQYLALLPVLKATTPKLRATRIERFVKHL